MKMVKVTAVDQITVGKWTYAPGAVFQCPLGVYENNKRALVMGGGEVNVGGEDGDDEQPSKPARKKRTYRRRKKSDD